jgi:hypothetical protein
MNQYFVNIRIKLIFKYPPDELFQGGKFKINLNPKSSSKCSKNDTRVKLRVLLKSYQTTVKLGYKELGNNERFFQSKRVIYYIYQPGYNKTRL